jgi:hypothetical protein
VPPETPSPSLTEPHWPQIVSALAVLGFFLTSVWAFNPDHLAPPPRHSPAHAPGETPVDGEGAQGGATEGPPPDQPGNADAATPWTTELPGGGTRIFDKKRFLVAYYGTAHTGALGVLGEASPDRIMPRLRAAARPFKREGEMIQPVYELIVTIADAGPGKDGDFNHDIRRSYVEEYVAAARRNKTLLILDIQPGRASFPDVAKRWEWALKDPWVGLALDPEWRVGPRQVPARVIGSVGPVEVNRTSAWLAELTRRNGLPEKVFMLHQFRTSMIRDIEKIRPREGLAMIQHVDGFGNPGQKLSTYQAVTRPKQFTMGFKLFYDEDRPRMRADGVRRIRPAVSFVSFQ